MIEAGDLLLAGVSGGADSVCLLLVLMELQQIFEFSLHVVHVEHGIRGDESREDADFVQELCRTKGIPCRVKPVDVPEYSKLNHIGLEEAARLLRYEALAQEVRRLAGQGEAFGKIRVALAHHMEDNAETILYQMLRGSGISGLRGMQPVRQAKEGFFYIRPLLCVQRGDIEEYLRMRGQAYREDVTNGDVAYARNRLRHRVFPELEQINGQAVVHMNRSAEQLGQIWDFLQKQAKEAAASIMEIRPEGICLSIERLLAQHPAVQEEVLRQALFAAAGQQKDISSVHISQLCELAQRQSGKRIDLPYGVKAWREFGDLVLADGHGRDEDRCLEIPVTQDMLAKLCQSGDSGKICLSPDEMLELRVFPFSGDSAKIIKKPYTKWFDYDKIKNGFRIRRRRPGDYFCIDQSGHRKKLKQYLIEEKIPSGRRDSLWLLCQEACIVWLIGGRISEGYKVFHDTAYILEVCYKKKPANSYKGESEHGICQKP